MKPYATSKRRFHNKLVWFQFPNGTRIIGLMKELFGKVPNGIKKGSAHRTRYKTDFGSLFEITLIVMRVPTAQSPNGVLILKYDLELKGAG